jgi:hypothetical protein
VDTKNQNPQPENPDGDGPVEKECVRCKQSHPYTIEHWPATNGRAVGLVCRLCSRSRKRDFDRSYQQTRVAARTQDLASLTGTQPPAARVANVPTTRDARKGELKLRQLDVAQALRVGADAINNNAREVIMRVFEYAATPSNPHHEWALRLIADRIIPRKLYEDLGSAAAGIKAGQGNVRPAVTIIVQPAAMPAPVEHSVQVIEGERIANASEV